MLLKALLLLQHSSDFSSSVKGHAYNPPDSPVYYLILAISSLIVLAAIIYSIKWTIRPGEQSEDHIKRKILNIGTGKTDQVETKSG